MPKLQIPERHQSSLATIRNLNELDIRAIRAILDRAPDTISPVEIAGTDAALTSAVPGSDIKGILEALASLYVLKAGTESVSLDQFVNDIGDAMTSLESSHRVTDEQLPVFKQNLISLLSVERFLLVSKAFELQTDDERTFCDARILTDIRPVFGTEIKDGSKGAVIVHLLKLGYHEPGRRHMKFYVSLDSSDLKELRKVIDRAEDKAAILKSQLKDMRFFGTS